MFVRGMRHMDENKYTNADSNDEVIREDVYGLRQKALKSSFKGLCIFLSAFISLGLAIGCFYISFIWITFVFFVIFGIWTLVAPVISCIWGFVGLFDKYRTKGSIAVSVLSFVLPIVTVLTIILLFSTGALVIRFM